MKLLRRLAWPLALTALTLALALALRRYVENAPGSTLAFERGGATFELLSPRMLALALLAPWFLWVLGRSLADLPWPQRVLSIGLRLAFVALLGLALARLSRTATTAKVCTVFAVDVSDSVPDEGLADARDAVVAALAARRPDDVVKLVTFARRPRAVDLPEGGAPPEVVRHDAPGAPTKLGSGSNPQAALQLAYGLFPPGYLKRVVLLSDGLQTDGDLLAEAERAKQFGVRVHTVASKRPVPAEVALRELKLPPKVRVGEAFEVRADVYASRPTKARARLFQGEALNGLDGVKQLDLKAGPNDVVFKSVVRVAGEVTYSLELDQLGEDKFPENNRYATTVDVPGRPAVLYVEGAPQSASYLSSALTAQQYDVDVRPPGGFPASLKELERYDFVILSDTPAERFGPDAQNLIEAYVRDLGGGFLFAGGESGYGLGGWQHSTVERLLPVRMDGEKRKDQPSVALSLVIDRSGSMAGLPIEMAKAAAKAAVEVLQPDDLVEVIAFDSQPTRYVKMSQARRKARIAGDISRVQPG
ncbi:MAG TPA: VWA domain-containing protein, partial [Polyangiaceae bacterium]|nr:VWA domain-containing protein [Polyangiaceae bacterium]